MSDNANTGEKQRKTPVFRFQYRLSKLEQQVLEVCEENGLSYEDAIADNKVKKALVAAALESIRPDAIQERLEESAAWLKARLAKYES